MRPKGNITHLNNISCFSFENFKYETLLNYCKTCKNSNMFQYIKQYEKRRSLKPTFETSYMYPNF